LVHSGGWLVDMAGIGLTRLSQICEVAHVSCLVEALTRVKPCLEAATMEVMRESISQDQMRLITHSLPFLVEDHRLRLPGELSHRLPAVPVDLHVQYGIEMAKVRQSSLARAMHKSNFDALLAQLLEAGLYSRAAWLQSATLGKRRLGRWLRGGLFPYLPPSTAVA